MARDIFSKRTGWDRSHNELSIVLEELKSKGIEILDLTESNPTRCGFQYPPDLIGALSNPKNLQYAPDSRGTLEAREAVARFHGLDAKNILLTASTSESYSFLFRLLLDPGDKVLIPRPSYPLFQFLLELNDASFEHYPLVYKDGAWRIDFEALKHLIYHKTKAIVLVNPNNPTGSYLKDDELVQLNAICKAHGISIISDEVFYDYRLVDGPFASLRGNADVLTFTMGGLSKSLGLPQMKLGWILASGPQAIVDEALERLEMIADTFLSVNTPVQNALPAWLAQAPNLQGQIMDRVKGNLDYLRKSKMEILHVEGGWYAILRKDGIDEEEFILRMLKEHHILLHPGYFFDFEQSGYLVLSLLPCKGQFAKMIETLRGNYV